MSGDRKGAGQVKSDWRFGDVLWEDWATEGGIMEISMDRNPTWDDYNDLTIRSSTNDDQSEESARMFLMGGL